MTYKRVLLKLSGEALMGDKPYGIDPAIVQSIAEDVERVIANKVQLAIVVGGGNIFRGLKGSADGMDRATADYVGMLATVMNAISLQDGEQNSDILVMLSESRLQQQDGLIDDGVERLINRALEINPNHPRGLYLRGLSLLQHGDKTEALAIWDDLHSSAEPDSPWQIFLRLQLSLHQ